MSTNALRPPPLPPSKDSDPPPAVKVTRVIFKTAVDLGALYVIHSLALAQSWPFYATLPAVCAIVGVWYDAVRKGRASPKYPAAAYPLLLLSPKTLAAMVAAFHRHGGA